MLYMYRPIAYMTVLNIFFFFFLLNIYLYWKTFSYKSGFRYPPVDSLINNNYGLTYIHFFNHSVANTNVLCLNYVIWCYIVVYI